MHRISGGAAGTAQAPETASHLIPAISDVGVHRIQAWAPAPSARTRIKSLVGDQNRTIGSGGANPLPEHSGCGSERAAPLGLSDLRALVSEPTTSTQSICTNWPARCTSWRRWRNKGKAPNNQSWIPWRSSKRIKSASQPQGPFWCASARSTDPAWWAHQGSNLGPAD